MKLHITLISSFFLLPLFVYGQVDPTLVFEKYKKTLFPPLANLKKLITIDSFKQEFSGSPTPGHKYYSEERQAVNAIFEGTVVSITNVEGQYCLITKFGNYFITYCGLTRPVVNKGEYIMARQRLADLEMNPGEDFELTLIISNRTMNLDASEWLK